jgi:O-antigen/teichoic acid export membrane protein
MSSAPDGPSLTMPEEGAPRGLLGRTRSSIRRVSTLMIGAGARSGYLSAIDQAIISLTNFVASLILARNVSPTQFGVYGVGFILVHFYDAFQEGLIIQPLNTFGAALDFREFRGYASLSFLFQVALVALAALSALLVGTVLVITGNDTAGPTVRALSWMVITWQLQEFLRRMFYTRGQLDRAIVNTTLTSIIRIGALVWLVANTRMTGISGLNAIALGALAGVLLGLWQGRKYWTRHLPPARTTLAHDLKFGRWVSGGTVANWVTLELYPVLAAWITSFATAGAYRAIQNLVAPVHMLLRATDTFLVPRTAKQFVEDGHRSVHRSMNLTYLFIGIPIVGLLVLVSVFAVPLLQLLYGDTYVAYASGVPIMALFYFFWYLYWPLQVSFKAVRQTRPIFVANLLAMASMLTVGIALIFRYGLYGTLAGQALNALIVAVVLWLAWWGMARARTAHLSREMEAGTSDSPEPSSRQGASR